MRRPQRTGAVPYSAHDPTPLPGNLPAELDRFVGRRTELAALKRRLERSRLVTVVGAAGAGKTRLALRAASAQQEQERFCDGVWLVELSCVQDPGLLERTVAEALGLAGSGPGPGRAPVTGLTERLADRRLLLVLDGFEHLADACAVLVRGLLRRAPGLSVLAVGRRPLGVAGEQSFPLAPLPAPEPSRSPDAAPPPFGDAAELFADRAAAVLPGFALTDAGRRAVAELCHRLDGLPLAVELAAGRLRSLSVEQMLRRLDDRFLLLTGGGAAVLPRHRTLRTAIGWSHELCTPRERLLWARLSVFAGTFDLEAAEYVCSGSGLPAEELLGLVGELVAQSVLVREDTLVGVRYRMLQSVRAYGWYWLDATGDTERMRRRHRDWYMGLATWCELDWFGPRQAEVAARTEAELPNLRAALEFCLNGGEEARLGQYLAGTLWFSWVGCGRLTEGRRWLDRALELESGHDEARLKALWVLGQVAVLQGDTAAGAAALRECREAAERTGNALAAAYALHRSGCLALIRDDPARAEELTRAALDRYRTLGELNSHVLMGQVTLALTVALRGDPAGAAALCQEVREVCRDHGERWTLAYASYALGYAAWAGSDSAGARTALEECLVTGAEFRDPALAALAVELLALLATESGDPEEAAVLQGAAGRLWLSVGVPFFGSRCLGAVHLLCARQAREALGTGRYEECLLEGARLDLDAAAARARRGGGRPARAVASPGRDRCTRRAPAAPPAHETASPAGGGGSGGGAGGGESAG